MPASARGSLAAVCTRSPTAAPALAAAAAAAASRRRWSRQTAQAALRGRLRRWRRRRPAQARRSQSDAHRREINVRCASTVDRNQTRVDGRSQSDAHRREIAVRCASTGDRSQTLMAAGSQSSAYGGGLAIRRSSWLADCPPKAHRRGLSFGFGSVLCAPRYLRPLAQHDGVHGAMVVETDFGDEGRGAQLALFEPDNGARGRRAIACARLCVCERERPCVCVCVCERERERERERESRGCARVHKAMGARGRAHTGARAAEGACLSVFSASASMREMRSFSIVAISSVGMQSMNSW